MPHSDSMCQEELVLMSIRYCISKLISGQSLLGLKILQVGLQELPLLKLSQRPRLSAYNLVKDSSLGLWRPVGFALD